MDGSIVRLMELNEKITRENDQFRLSLEARQKELKERLETEYGEREKQLGAQFTAKEDELKQREAALVARGKTLDDRDNTHARRQKQEDLSRRLQQHQASFNLTSDTTKKRIPVMIAFWAGLAFLGVLVGVYTWRALQPLESGIPFWWHPLRVIGFTAGFVGLLVYFIRWQDRWSQTHADEEFRLKRLELDSVRAGWLVEVLLEWQREHKTDVPPELIEKLGAGLFEQSSGQPGATHPVEDIIARLLGNSSLQLEFPGGKAALDRKAIDRAKSAGA
jgi:hypothetical protein